MDSNNDVTKMSNYKLTGKIIRNVDQLIGMFTIQYYCR